MRQINSFLNFARAFAIAVGSLSLSSSLLADWQTAASVEVGHATAVFHQNSNAFWWGTAPGSESGYIGSVDVWINGAYRTWWAGSGSNNWKYAQNGQLKVRITPNYRYDDLPIQYLVLYSDGTSFQLKSDPSTMTPEELEQERNPPIVLDDDIPWTKEYLEKSGMSQDQAEKFRKLYPSVKYVKKLNLENGVAYKKYYPANLDSIGFKG